MTGTHNGTRVIVTAAAAGIGKAIAEAFAGAGARVHVCDVDVAGLDALHRTHRNCFKLPNLIVLAITRKAHLCRDIYLVPISHALDHLADHPLAVAAEVEMCRVEMVETEIEGLAQKVGVVRVHDPEAHQGNLQTGLPERPIYRFAPGLDGVRRTAFRARCDGCFENCRFPPPRCESGPRWGRARRPGDRGSRGACRPG